MGSSEGRENPHEVGDLFREDHPTKIQQDGWSGEWGVRMMNLNFTSMRWPRPDIRGWGIENNKICGSVPIVYKHYWFQQNRQGNQSLETFNDLAETRELVQSREEILRQHRGLGLGLENTGCPRSHVKTRWSDVDGKMSPPLHSLLKNAGWLNLSPSKCQRKLDPRAQVTST